MTRKPNHGIAVPWNYVNLCRMLFPRLQLAGEQFVGCVQNCLPETRQQVKKREPSGGERFSFSSAEGEEEPV